MLSADVLFAMLWSGVLSRMLKAIFFDIDGTLYSHRTNRVPESCQRAFQQLHEKKILTIACTGRHVLELEELNIHDYLDFDAYITLNGQYCYNDQGLIYDLPIDPQDVDLVIQDASKKHYPVIFVERDKMYINIQNDYVKKVQDDIHSSVPPLGKLSHENKIYQMIPYLPSSKDYIDLPHCAKNIWHPGAFDLIPKQGGKDQGIKEVLKYYHISTDEIMAFGDAANDISMLEYANIGVAMGNASDEVKKHADFVTTDIDDDGIYNALKYFQIID